MTVFLDFLSPNLIAAHQQEMILRMSVKTKRKSERYMINVSNVLFLLTELFHEPLAGSPLYIYFVLGS